MYTGLDQETATACRIECKALHIGDKQSLNVLPPPSQQRPSKVGKLDLQSDMM